MIRSRVRAFLPALLAALAAAGCESATLSSDEVQGTYVLVSYNGAPLPGETASLEDARHYILADTIELGPDGSGTQTTLSRVDYRNPAVADREVASVQTFSYEIDDDRLRVTYGCPLLDTAPAATFDGVHPTTCVPGPHAIGRIEGDDLVISTRVAVLRFRRDQD